MNTHIWKHTPQLCDKSTDWKGISPVLKVFRVGGGGGGGGGGGAGTGTGGGVGAEGAQDALTGTFASVISSMTKGGKN